MNNELKQNIKDHETQMNIIASQKLQLEQDLIAEKEKNNQPDPKVE